MWVAGIWPLSLLVAGFSGAWPYLKLVLMFASWLTPKRWLPIKYREYILMALDALGKWSLLDSYIMILMLVAFRFSIAFPIHNPETTSVTGPIVIDVIVDPLIGFIAFLVATIVSLILGHVIVALHRYAESPSQHTADAAASEKEALCKHVLHTCSPTTKVLCGIAVGGLLILTFLLMATGIYVEAFAFEFKGAAAWFLDIIGEEVVSVFHFFFQLQRLIVLIP